MPLYALDEAVIRGDYKPGEKLPAERKLRDLPGVSRTSLGEAVKALVAKGRGSTGPKIGTLVLRRERWNWFDGGVVSWLFMPFAPFALANFRALASTLEWLPVLSPGL